MQSRLSLALRAFPHAARGGSSLEGRHRVRRNAGPAGPLRRRHLRQPPDQVGQSLRVEPLALDARLQMGLGGAAKCIGNLLVLGLYLVVECLEVARMPAAQVIDPGRELGPVLPGQEVPESACAGLLLPCADMHQGLVHQPVAHPALGLRKVLVGHAGNTVGQWQAATQPRLQGKGNLQFLLRDVDPCRMRRGELPQRAPVEQLQRRFLQLLR